MSRRLNKDSKGVLVNEPLCNVIRVNQSVQCLDTVTENDILAKMCDILNVPYKLGQFTPEKAKRVVANCVQRGHTSVLEHTSLTLKCITNVGTYKDFTRHRHASFTIESTSFVHYNELVVILAPHKPPVHNENDGLLDYELNALKNSFLAYSALPPKEGRDYLPQCVAATMIMTTNIRQWRYIVGLRGDPNDNPLTNELRDLIWCRLNYRFPFFFPCPENIPDNAMAIKDQWREDNRPPAQLCNSALFQDEPRKN